MGIATVAAKRERPSTRRADTWARDPSDDVHRRPETVSDRRRLVPTKTVAIAQPSSGGVQFIDDREHVAVHAACKNGQPVGFVDE
jgi:hypothetical protein